MHSLELRNGLYSVQRLIQLLHSNDHCDICLCQDIRRSMRSHKERLLRNDAGEILDSIGKCLKILVKIAAFTEILDLKCFF